MLIFFWSIVNPILISFILGFYVGFYLFEMKKKRNKIDQLKDEIEQFILSYNKKHGFVIKLVARNGRRQ